MSRFPKNALLIQFFAYFNAGKSFEDQARKLYEMAEAFAQKYEKRLHEVRLAETQNQGIHEPQAPAGGP